MKRIVLSAALAMGVLVASAQTSSGTVATNSKTNNTSRVSTDAEIRQMANQLQLNEATYIKFRDLNKARNEQLREANNMYANDAAGLKSRVQAINKNFESQLAQSVSEKQFTAYLESQGRTPAGSGYQAAGYGGNSMESGAATGTSVNGGAVDANSTDEANKAAVIEYGNKNQSSTKEEKRKKKAKNKKNKNIE